MEARAAVEHAARTSYGRLVALVSRKTRDIAAAEDCLSEALAAALKQWPLEGVPQSPEAWLVNAAQRQWLSQLRKKSTASDAETSLKLLIDELAHATMDGSLPSATLQLLFVCAHPAIDATMRTPLMMQTVLGLSAEQIGGAFLVAPKTMGQRLSRVKTKIRDAGLSFDIPAGQRLSARLEDVLEAIYGCFGVGHQLSALDTDDDDLSTEALSLARMVTELLPQEPETAGLLSLILHCQARRFGRVVDGEFVPLSQQDTRRWDVAQLAEAEAVLRTAATFQRPGRFQLEAAIQSAHNERLLRGTVQWQDIVNLYLLLLSRAPTVGAQLGYASVLGEGMKTPQAGIEVLNGIEPSLMQAFQPYWAVRAQLLKQCGQREAATHAFARAIGLTRDPALRRYLLRISSTS